MKKTRMLATVASAAIVVVGVVPATTGKLSSNFMMFGPGDSPIDISDGSISANVGILNSNYWDRIADGEVYKTRSTNDDYIVLHNFTSSNSTSGDFTFQQTGGWLITITTGDPNDPSTVDPAAISFCSNVPSPVISCDPTSLTLSKDNQTVYIETHPDANNPHGHNGRWEEKYFTKTLKFHDTRSPCTRDDKRCNHILAISLMTASSSSGNPGPTGTPFTCPTANIDQCTIKVGQ